jgi:hypothetical protein
MIGILISVFVDVFLKPMYKNLKSEYKAGVSRLLLFGISISALFFLRKDTFIEDGITTTVIAMLFYDVAGYSLLAKKIKERLGDESKINTK